LRVLITGGSGRVGTTVVEHLQADHEVTVFDIQPPRVAGVKHIAGDILELDQINAAVADADAVVSLAAIPMPIPGDEEHVFKVNVVGLHNVLLAAERCGIERVVHASSDSTLGFVFGSGKVAPQYLPIDEVHPLAPEDTYGLSKLINEKTCRAVSRRTGMTTICLRYCWVWTAENYRQASQLVGNPEENIRGLWAYIDMRDVAGAVGKALTAPVQGFEVFLLSAADTHCEMPTLELVARYLPDTGYIRKPAQFQERPHRSLLDFSKAERMLGWQPHYTWRAECERLQTDAEQ